MASTLSLLLIISTFTAISAAPAEASLAHPKVVSENPSDTTPHIVLDGVSQNVYAFEQIGRTMFAGGRFDTVQDPAMTQTYARSNFVVFDADTGVVSDLNLSFDGMVTGIVKTADESALFISGAFSQVNGITRRGIAKYDLVNDRIDPTFAPTGMRTVSDIRIANGWLIAVGNFSKHVMAMDQVTGADLGHINLTVAGVVDPTDETRVKKIAISPDGTRLVATGNFATVNGQNRKRAFMLNLAQTTTLSTWYAPRFAVNCVAASRLVSAQGIDFSPDGSYFVVVSTGGPTGTNGICDATARFETANVASNVQPTWINWTGGDTLYSVAVTGAAVYVGGHQRWLDNPQGSDFAGPGAVSRPGIGAIDPVTGKALAWNPTKSRNHGTMVLFATPDGLWVGSDGERFGNEDHVGIGFVPLDDTDPPDTARPNTFIESGPAGPVTNATATFTFSADEDAVFQCRLDDAAFAPCSSPMTYEALAEGPHTFRVAAVDPSFNMDATPAEQAFEIVPEGTELVGNPGFEVDTSGWAIDASGNTLTRVAGGHSGDWAAELAAGSAGRCGIDDFPGWVPTTEAGTYTTSAWLRSDTSGSTVRLRVREYADGVRQGTTTESISLTSSWQQVTAAHTTVTPGSSLDVEIYLTDATAGPCFQVDDVSMTLDPLDLDAPETTIDDGPTGDTTNTSATFTFSADEDATFTCRVDGGAWEPCTSPTTHDDLAIGPHTFEVAAIDTAGNTDATPASRSWTVVDQTAPDTTIDDGPTGEVTDTSATFTFSADEAATFACRLDDGAWAPCTSPVTLDGLSVGTHTFAVAATDASGNVDATPASREWTVVDLAAPETTIDDGPTGEVTDTSATFGFSADEDATFACRLDGADFAACTSPVTFDDLGHGTHTFEVVATDPSGNVDETPASREWTILDDRPELVGNPDFEVDTSGWTADTADTTLARVPGGHSGDWVAELTTAAGGRCGIDDSPNWVLATGEGTYTASVWLRAETPGATVQLRLRGYLDGDLQATVSESLVLTSSWQQLTATYTTATPGSMLDLEIYTTDAATGPCFQADDVSIRSDAAPPPDTTAPQTSIDAGPSGDVDGTSATFAFSADEEATFACRLDGGTWEPCTSPVTHDGLAFGAHTFEVAATDTAGNADPSPASASWTIVDAGPELVGNPGFEVDTAGWRGDAAGNTLARVAGGHSGDWALAVTASSAGRCGIDDHPNWVTSTVDGSYLVSAWVRADTPGATLRLRIRGYLGGVRQATVTQATTLGTEWQQVTATYPTAAAGSLLDVEAYVTDAAAGACFTADDVSIRHVGP
ncbi:carbohydrate binding domain-containing protein [Salsipaludibacter albus]|uniref:carbohydrate binding domain-containing protein n=1 Tax=Salsipaludibacter albus TaxID=2849650 RepID=UPI001EE47280|nr:carbohydrate binding domain-containing protein [Salsipaludibacter albus]MBY5164137.1 carbohydrate binding domain-containing protein [Salsipaludibacter albus]